MVHQGPAKTVRQGSYESERVVGVSERVVGSGGSNRGAAMYKTCGLLTLELV